MKSCFSFLLSIFVVLMVVGIVVKIITFIFVLLVGLVLLALGLIAAGLILVGVLLLVKYMYKMLSREYDYFVKQFSKRQDYLQLSSSEVVDLNFWEEESPVLKNEKI